MIPGDLKYTEEHEWIRQEGKLVTVGISDFAQDQMTDIVFVELPETGRKVSAGEAIVVLESVKSVADVYAPTSGTVTEINSDLEHHPEYINESPYEKGWIFKMEASGEITAKFLDAEGYQAFIDTQ
ncbi:MAG: glycine cleavage system protein GcvH [SAR324 cluster bacterium]|nr:glycine cleavage system protein GcvH [SAR324 cluster bacterium]